MFELCFRAWNSCSCGLRCIENWKSYRFHNAFEFCNCVSHVFVITGIQRGCSPPEGTNASRIFLADGNAYRQDGSCQTGQFKNISVPYNQLFNTNLQPIYLFSGVYCLCSGDRCNEGSSLFAPSALVISSFFFVLLSVAGQKWFLTIIHIWSTAHIKVTKVIAIAIVIVIVITITIVIAITVVMVIQIVIVIVIAITIVIAIVILILIAVVIAIVIVN